MCEIFNDHWGYAADDLFYKAPAYIIEELADVINCVEQLIYIYGEEKVQKVRKEKLERLFSKYDFD